MAMPSITSWGAVHGAPIGQIAETSKPARRSVPSSSHTRRSKGSGRFSETWRILPRDTLLHPGLHVEHRDPLEPVDLGRVAFEKAREAALRIQILGAAEHHPDAAGARSCLVPLLLQARRALHEAEPEAIDRRRPPLV